MTDISREKILSSKPWELEIIALILRDRVDELEALVRIDDEFLADDLLDAINAASDDPWPADDKSLARLAAFGSRLTRWLNESRTQQGLRTPAVGTD